MKMDDMVSYLESKGFKASKKYISERGHYEFHIEKDGRGMISCFTYPGGAPRHVVNRAQEDFLDSMLDRFERECGKKKPTNFYQAVAELKEASIKAGKFEIPIRIDSFEVKSCAGEAETGSMDFTFYSLPDQFAEYCKNDVKMTEEVYKMWPKINPFLAQGCGIKKVIFNDPATIVMWTDGTKTVVKAENEAFDEEKGLAMAISKKALGNKGNYYNTFTKWLPKEEEAVDGCSLSDFVRACNDLFGFTSKTTKSLKKENDELYDKLDRADHYILLLEDTLDKAGVHNQDILNILNEYWGDKKR